MTLYQFQELLKVDDYAKQMQILGKNIDNMTVKEMETVIKDELSIDYSPKFSKKFNTKGRKFNVTIDIESLKAGEYAYFKQLLGNSVADDITDDGTIIIVEENEKIYRLFKVAHKILAIFLKETTWFKRHLDFGKKQELLLYSEIKDIVPLIFFLWNKIGNLQRATQIYYLNQVKIQSQKEDDYS